MKKFFIYLIPVLFVFSILISGDNVRSQSVSNSIENVTEDVATSSVTIQWDTNMNLGAGISNILYSTSSQMTNTVYVESEPLGEPVVSPSEVYTLTRRSEITNLECSTTYYYTISLYYSEGAQDITTHNDSFTTSPCETAIENVVEEVATSSVTINWDTVTLITTGVNDLIHSTSSHPILNPIPTNLSFEIFNADMDTHRASHQAQLTDLTCDTTYYYSILLYDHGVSVDDPALTYDDSFTTSACDGGSEANMTIVSDRTSIIFTFDIDELPPNQSVEYGTDENYGGSLEYVSNPTVNSIKISNLNCGTPYYYSITADGSYDEGGEILIAEGGVYNTASCRSSGGGGGGSSRNNNDDDNTDNTDDQSQDDTYDDKEVVIEKEDADAIVRIIQIFLNILGFDVALTGPGSYGYETFFFGKLTQAAITKYQEAKGIEQTGNIDVLTVKTLVNDMFPFVETVDNRKWNEKHVLASVGDTGFLPRLVQVFLNTLGYNVATFGPGSTAEETENFGTLTEKALREYQTSNGIEETGNIDVATVRYMISDIFPFIDNKSKKCESLYATNKSHVSINNTKALNRFMKCSDFEDENDLSRMEDFKEIVSLYLDEGIGIDVPILSEDEVKEALEYSLEPISEIGMFNEDEYVYSYGYTNLESNWQSSCERKTVRLYDQSTDKKYIKQLKTEKPFLSKFGGICSIMSSALSIKYSLGFKNAPEGWPQDDYVYDEKTYIEERKKKIDLVYPDYSEQEKKDLLNKSLKKRREDKELNFDGETYFNPYYLQKLTENAGIKPSFFGGKGVPTVKSGDFYENYPGGQNETRDYIFMPFELKALEKQFTDIGYIKLKTIQDILDLKKKNPKVDCNLNTENHISNIKNIDEDKIVIHNTLDQGAYDNGATYFDTLIPSNPKSTTFKIDMKGGGGLFYVSGEEKIYWKSLENPKIEFIIRCHEFVEDVEDETEEDPEDEVETDFEVDEDTCQAEEYETEQRFYCGADLSGKDIVNSICGSKVKLNLIDISKGGMSGRVDINTTPCQKAESALMILQDYLKGAEKALADHIKDKKDLLKSCTVNDWDEFKNKIEEEISDYKEQVAAVEKYKTEICGVAECKRLNEQLAYYENELKKLSSGQEKTRRLIQNEIDALKAKKAKLNCK